MSLGTAGYGAVLTQPDKFGKNNVSAYASRELLSYENNYQPFVAEMMAAKRTILATTSRDATSRFTLTINH